MFRLELDQTTQRPTCVCPFFSAKFSDGNCYQEYTRGPCPYGKLIMLDRETGLGKCYCSKDQVIYIANFQQKCSIMELILI